MDNDDICSVDLDALRMVVNAFPVIGAYAALVSSALHLQRHGLLVTDPAEPDWLGSTDQEVRYAA